MHMFAHSRTVEKLRLYYLYVTALTDLNITILLQGPAPWYSIARYNVMMVEWDRALSLSGVAPDPGRGSISLHSFWPFGTRQKLFHEPLNIWVTDHSSGSCLRSAVYWLLLLCLLSSLNGCHSYHVTHTAKYLVMFCGPTKEEESLRKTVLREMNPTHTSTPK